MTLWEKLGTARARVQSKSFLTSWIAILKMENELNKGGDHVHSNHSGSGGHASRDIRKRPQDLGYMSNHAMVFSLRPEVLAAWRAF
jgi:hypothetical protein